MTNQDIQAGVHHEPGEQRFVVTIDGVTAELAYERRADVIRITHTGVPPSIGGRGVAAELMRAALEYARSERLQVDPVCSYAATYFRRHPEFTDVLAP